MRDMASSLACRLLQWFCSCVLQQQYLALFVLRGYNFSRSGAPLHDSRVGTIEMLCNQLVRSYTAHSCNAVTVVCERLWSGGRRGTVRGMEQEQVISRSN